MYRDDGIVFFKGFWSNDDIDIWLKTFQISVNDLCDSNGLKFTAEIWRYGENDVSINSKMNKQITIVK